MRGKPIILTNCEENIDNVITPLIHHRNTAEENDKNEGTLNIIYKDLDLMKDNVIFITIPSDPIYHRINAIYTDLVYVHIWCLFKGQNDKQSFQ